MLTCPVCATPNQEGSVSCEHCNFALSSSVDETVVAGNGAESRAGEQATVIATAAFTAISTGAAAPARAFAELSIGHVLNNRYEILARLGQGGMGTVYKVLDRELDRIIALKTIRPDLASNASSLRRLKQETLLARQIAHRNVIRVFDLGVADGLRFITMEFVGGQDLRSLLDARSKLTVEETIDVLGQLCRGLHAAHSEDVVHRDLKPHNVLLSANGRIRIVDFGLARSFEDTRITHAGGILGTPTYMSPEQALGQEGDARSDLFSLGIIAFELLTGQLPFPNQPLSEALLSRTRGFARPIESVDPTLPPWLTKIVMRCLERNPVDRFATAAQVLAELEARGSNATSFAAAGPTTELAPGSMLGSRYRIEAEAGEGGIGKVYRATDLDLHRTVALKVVRPELAQSPHTLEQLMQEISVASQISHKNVLRIHDLGEASGLRFVSMAWAEGEDLAQLLRRTGPLPEARIRELAIEICEGLQAAHEQGISHRDLKPSNILLTFAGHACIADFGLARSSVNPVPLSGESTDSSSGTPRYMSPEQVDGTCVDHRTDIYSLGLILHEMATGRIPFSDASIVQTVTERLTETPANPRILNPAISDNLAHIILRCLERDPNQRYARVQDLLIELHYPGDAPVVAPAKRFARRFWMFSAVAAVLLAAAGATILWQRRKPAIEPPTKGKYVAVLPFHFVGSDPKLKYRAEGVAEAVSARLASLNSIHPVSTAALDSASLAEPENAIARQVGANLLVEGTVQGEGDRIKVDAEIYNVEQHRALWTHSYNGVNADLFNLEDEIADDTEDALKVKPTLEERERQVSAPTQNLAAYDLYLKGRDILRNHRDEANARAALALFEKACQTDSQFALAWTGVADTSNLLYSITKNSADSTKAVAAAEQARRLNGSLPEVHFALGSVYSATGRNAEAVEEIKQALQLSPNADSGYIRLGRAYMATGDEKEALAALKKAVELNPYYWYNHKQLGFAYSNFGQLNEAKQQFQEEVAQNPSDASGYNNIGTIYWRQAQWKKAIPEFEKAIQLRPSFDEYSNLASAYTQLGRYKESVAVYQKALALNPNQPEVVRNLAEAYARIGERDLANKTFKQAIGLFYDELAVNHQDADAFGGLALCYVGINDTAKARALISKARAIDSADSSLMYDEAYIEAADGQIDRAVAALRNAFAHGASFEYFLSDPDLKTVRDSPAFKSLKQQYGRH